MHGNINYVNNITDVIHTKPDFGTEILQFPEDASSNDDDNVVENSDGYDEQPLVILMSRRVKH